MIRLLWKINESTGSGAPKYLLNIIIFLLVTLSNLELNMQNVKATNGQFNTLFDSMEKECSSVFDGIGWSIQAKYHYTMFSTDPKVN